MKGVPELLFLRGNAGGRGGRVEKKKDDFEIRGEIGGGLQGVLPLSI